MAKRRQRPGLLRKLADAILPRSWLARIGVLLGALALAALVSLNLAVAFFGDTLVNPLSPFSLHAKVHALELYFAHRSRCLVRGGDPEVMPIVTAAAKRHRLDPHLLQALVEVESNGRCHRISPVGAMGPAQLVGSTAKLLGVRDPFDPEENVEAGARYLKEQLVRFDGNTALAVAAYNAGPGAIVQGRVPHNGETEFYVARVLARWKELGPVNPRPPRAPVMAVRRTKRTSMR